MYNRFSFVVKACCYRIYYMKDSCSFIDDYCFVFRTLAVKYDLGDLRYSAETVKNAVWCSFVNSLDFSYTM